jgi:hypothetical protein
MRCLVVALLAAIACHAEESCTFLNAATAAGVLEGQVTSQIHSDVCVFTHDSSQLRIEVRTVNLPYKPACQPDPTSLKSIGNEAVACESDRSEQIAGRVRDRAFFIWLTSNHIARAALREKSRSVAEQVAGTLF